MKSSCFRGEWVGGWVVGGNEIKATQPNLAWAWPELGNFFQMCMLNGFPILLALIPSVLGKTSEQ